MPLCEKGIHTEKEDKATGVESGVIQWYKATGAVRIHNSAAGARIHYAVAHRDAGKWSLNISIKFRNILCTISRTSDLKSQVGVAAYYTLWLDTLWNR